MVSTIGKGSPISPASRRRGPPQWRWLRDSFSSSSPGNGWSVCSAPAVRADRVIRGETGQYRSQRRVGRHRRDRRVLLHSQRHQHRNIFVAPAPDLRSASLADLVGEMGELRLAGDTEWLWFRRHDRVTIPRSRSNCQAGLEAARTVAILVEFDGERDPVSPSAHAYNI